MDYNPPPDLLSETSIKKEQAEPLAPPVNLMSVYFPYYTHIIII